MPLQIPVRREELPAGDALETFESLLAKVDGLVVPPHVTLLFEDAAARRVTAWNFPAQMDLTIMIPHQSHLRKYLAASGAWELASNHPLLGANIER